jgi:hypothetical protein
MVNHDADIARASKGKSRLSAVNPPALSQLGTRNAACLPASGRYVVKNRRDTNYGTTVLRHCSLFGSKQKRLCGVPQKLILYQERFMSSPMWPMLRTNDRKTFRNIARSLGHKPKILSEVIPKP